MVFQDTENVIHMVPAHECHVQNAGKSCSIVVKGRNFQVAGNWTLTTGDQMTNVYNAMCNARNATMGNMGNP